MLDINLFVRTPFGRDEAVIDVIYDVTLPEGQYWGLGLRHILSPHAATYITCLLVDLLKQSASNTLNWCYACATIATAGHP